MFTSVPNNMIENETDLVIPTCHETANPTPSITWFKDGNLIGSGDTLKFAGLFPDQRLRNMCARGVIIRE